jgi:two-component system alkaline phosphatase synthesis response regulator PhoP
MTKNSKKILIIEDEPDILELLVDKFVSEKFKVLQSTSAERGIKLALENKPDFILLDIILLKMDGITMLKKLRQNPWGKNVPVIILSNVTDQAKVSEAMRLGVYDYIIKTNLILNDLVKQVKEVTNF